MNQGIRFAGSQRNVLEFRESSKFARPRTLRGGLERHARPRRKEVRGFKWKAAIARS